MHSSFAFAIFAILACANAWVIPPGTEEGVYTVIQRDNGEEQHLQVAARGDSLFESFMEEDPELNSLDKRSTRLYCGCGFTMDHGNCDAAVADLSRQLDGTGPKTGKYINPKQSFYAIRTNVVAFACNRNTVYPAFLSGQQYGDYLKRITYACGAYIAGADQETYGDGFTIWGYARYQPGDDFCGASTTSPVSHC